MRNLIVTILLSAAIASGIGYSLGSKTSPSQVTTSDTAYDRIIKSGKIRCGYIIYPPSLIRDPNTGAFSGISYDIMTQMGKDLGVNIEWSEETTSATMVESLNTGRYDILCTSMWASSARGKVARFTMPVYLTALNAYVRKDDVRFKENERAFDKSDLTIATIDGGIAASIAREDAPHAKTYSMPDYTDFSELLLSVKNKKADLTFSENAQAARFNSSYPDSLKNITPAQPMRLFANGFVTKIGDERLVAMLNNALQNLHNNGFIEKTLSTYNSSDSYYHIAKTYR